MSRKVLDILLKYKKD